MTMYGSIHYQKINGCLSKEDSSIQIGARISSKGWINEDVDVVTFFGGLAVVKNNDGTFHCNEIWRYNISTNSYSVLHGNSYFNSSYHDLNPIINDQSLKEYNENDWPGGRTYHEIVKINSDEIFLVGGEGYFLGEEPMKSLSTLADWWMYSISLNQWKYLGGELGYTFLNPQSIYTYNTYHQDNQFGTIKDTSGIKINEEELLFFGGRMQVADSFSYTINYVQKYNITGNMWKCSTTNKILYYGNGYSRSYNSSNIPGGRENHKIVKINDEEFVLFAGNGVTSTDSGLLNDEWYYNTKLDLWKFSGKEKTKYKNRYMEISDNEYSEETLMGGMGNFIMEYIPNTKELIIFLGYGYDRNGKGKLNDCWKVYKGNICQFKEESNPEVCNSQGTCEEYNLCSCFEGFFGEDCELTKCNGILSNDTDVCSKNGICLNSKCLCYDQSPYNNDNCELNQTLETLANNLWIIIVAVISILVFLVLLVLVFIFIVVVISKLSKKLKKFEGIEDVDIILEEQKLAKDTSIAQFRINQKMFEIDVKEIEIIEKIGQGGSNESVFLGNWNNQKVAYKCFQVNEFQGTAKFSEFEKEVEILASISFPFILNFFGATMNSHRLGFVMEFAENGDLEKFLKQYNKKHSTKYSIQEKIRMLNEIASAMLFLHNKNILHRDLKLQNVLVTDKEETKLMDFGLSKFVKSEKTKTVLVGTSLFMAPEVFEGKYSYPCDVFSFSILMFIVLTENYSPYGNNIYNIEHRIAKDPNLRPNLKELDKLDISDQIKNTIERNWNHETSNRMNFKEISEFFRKNKFQSETKETKKDLKLIIEKRDKRINDQQKRILELQREVYFLKKQNRKGTKPPKLPKKPKNLSHSHRLSVKTKKPPPKVPLRNSSTKF